jgi:hypothetical protein
VYDGPERPKLKRATPQSSTTQRSWKEGTMNQVMIWYLRFLHISDDFLKHAIDLYNAGKLNPDQRLALEVIDGCVGPGDAIVTK